VLALEYLLARGKSCGLILANAHAYSVKKEVIAAGATSPTCLNLPVEALKPLNDVVVFRRVPSEEPRSWGDGFGHHAHASDVTSTT
jgi:hypothetical protein